MPDNHAILNNYYRNARVLSGSNSYWGKTLCGKFSSKLRNTTSSIIKLVIKYIRLSLTRRVESSFRNTSGCRSSAHVHCPRVFAKAKYSGPCVCLEDLRLLADLDQLAVVKLGNHQVKTNKSYNEGNREKDRVEKNSASCSTVSRTPVGDLILSPGRGLGYYVYDKIVHKFVKLGYLGSFEDDSERSIIISGKTSDLINRAA